MREIFLTEAALGDANGRQFLEKSPVGAGDALELRPARLTPSFRGIAAHRHMTHVFAGEFVGLVVVTDDRVLVNLLAGGKALTARVEGIHKIGQRIVVDLHVFLLE